MVLYVEGENAKLLCVDVNATKLISYLMRKDDFFLTFLDDDDENIKKTTTRDFLNLISHVKRFPLFSSI